MDDPWGEEQARLLHQAMTRAGITLEQLWQPYLHMGVRHKPSDGCHKGAPQPFTPADSAVRLPVGGIQHQEPRRWDQGWSSGGKPAGPLS